MKKTLVYIILLLLPFSIKAHCFQGTLIYYQTFSNTIKDLEKKHFDVKKLKNKFDILMTKCEISDDNTAICNDSNAYDDFLKEWQYFIQSLKGEKKKYFLEYAQQHQLENKEMHTP